MLFPGGPRPHPATRAVNGYGLPQLLSYIFPILSRDSSCDKIAQRKRAAKQRRKKSFLVVRVWGRGGQRKRCTAAIRSVRLGGDRGHFGVVAGQLRDAVAREERLLDAGSAAVRRPVEELLALRDLPAVLPGRQQRHAVAVLGRRLDASAQVVAAALAVAADAVVQAQSTTTPAALSIYGE